MAVSTASVLAACVACMLCACTPAAPTRSPTTVTGADEGTRAAIEPPAAAPSLMEPVRTRVEHCRTTAGGKLLIRVQRAPGGKLAFDVAPGSSLDPTERKCVLEALSTLDIDESSTAWAGGLNVRPTGFTSLLTIEW